MRVTFSGVLRTNKLIDNQYINEKWTVCSLPDKKIEIFENMILNDRKKCKSCGGFKNMTCLMKYT